MFTINKSKSHRKAYHTSAPQFPIMDSQLDPSLINPYQECSVPSIHAPIIDR